MILGGAATVIALTAVIQVADRSLDHVAALLAIEGPSLGAVFVVQTTKAILHLAVSRVLFVMWQLAYIKRYIRSLCHNHCHPMCVLR